VHAAHLIERQKLKGKFVAFDRELGVPPIKVVSDNIFCGELRAIDRLDQLEVELVGFFPPPDRLERHVGPAIVLARITDDGRKLRRFLHGVFPGNFEKPAEPLCVVARFLVRQQLFAARRKFLRGERAQSHANES
jgi:hypothetical protein